MEKFLREGLENKVEEIFMKVGKKNLKTGKKREKIKKDYLKVYWLNNRNLKKVVRENIAGNY